MSRAFQLANFPVEGQEIVGQQLVERVEFGVEFRVQRVDPAIEPPPHRAQGAQDGDEGSKFCPVHDSVIADSQSARQAALITGREGRRSARKSLIYGEGTRHRPARDRAVQDRGDGEVLSPQDGNDGDRLPVAMGNFGDKARPAPTLAAVRGLEEIARAVLRLASDDSSFVTGQALAL